MEVEAEAEVAAVAEEDPEVLGSTADWGMAGREDRADCRGYRRADWGRAGWDQAGWGLGGWDRAGWGRADWGQEDWGPVA